MAPRPSSPSLCLPSPSILFLSSHFSLSFPWRFLPVHGCGPLGQGCTQILETQGLSAEQTKLYLASLNPRFSPLNECSHLTPRSPQDTLFLSISNLWRDILFTCLNCKLYSSHYNIIQMITKHKTKLVSSNIRSARQYPRWSRRARGWRWRSNIQRWTESESFPPQLNYQPHLHSNIFSPSFIPHRAAWLNLNSICDKPHWAEICCIQWEHATWSQLGAAFFLIYNSSTHIQYTYHITKALNYRPVHTNPWLFYSLILILKRS